jgi:hypothetical protein
MRFNPWLAGALSGVVWWALSLVLGGGAYGVLGRYAVSGLVSGIGTGIAMTALSLPVYRHLPARSLYWFSPISVYVSVAIYGLLVFAIRMALDDFHPDQNRLAVGLQSIVGMWWGITILLPVAIVVQLSAYLNHRLLRRVLA